MSYRTFKRVLGETSLERKCRWWFGISLAVLLLVSFTWAQRQIEKEVDARMDMLGQELVRAGWQERHLAKMAVLQKGMPDAYDETFFEELAKSSEQLGHEFQGWDAIYPPAIHARAR
jgi:hypothetical protein